MKKIKKMISAVLSVTLLINSVNYDVIAAEVSEKIQEYKERQTQDEVTQTEETQLVQTEETVSETTPLISDEITEKVSEITSTTGISETAKLPETTLVTEAVTAETQISQETAPPITSDIDSFDIDNISFETTLDESQVINADESYSQNTKINGSLTVASQGQLQIKHGTVLEILEDLILESGSIFNVSEGGVKVIVRGNIIIGGRLHVSNSSIITEGNIVEKDNSEIQGNGEFVLTGNKQQTVDVKKRISRLINKNTSGQLLVFINSLNFEMYEDNGNGIISYEKDEKGEYTKQECPVLIDSDNINFLFVRVRTLLYLTRNL